jgi:uncharacterized protein (TIGR00269 family)
MKCSRCDSPAVMSRRHSGIQLCERHLIEDFERKAERTILWERMAADGDRVAVAVSGGKDSTALLHVLNRILEGRDIELLAITVDEGIEGYRDDTIMSARRITKDLGIEHEIVSFSDEYGFDLDQIVEGNDAAPCTYCGVFRKSALNRAAKRLGATKVAVGHNLDDEVQSIMMNYMKGDIERLMRFRPRRIQQGLIPRIKPLREIPEKEIALYCMVNGIFTESRECPYAHLSLRADVRDMMNRLENLYPGIKHSSLKGFERFLERAGSQWTQMDLASCTVCGEPCVKDVCKTCELLGKLKGAKAN